MRSEFELGDILVQIGDTQKWVVDEIHSARDGHPEGFSIEYTLWRIVENEPTFWMEEEMPMTQEIDGWEARKFWVKVGNIDKKEGEDD